MKQSLNEAETNFYRVVTRRGFSQQKVHWNKLALSAARRFRFSVNFCLVFGNILVLVTALWNCIHILNTLLYFTLMYLTGITAFWCCRFCCSDLLIRGSYFNKLAIEFTLLLRLISPNLMTNQSIFGLHHRQLEDTHSWTKASHLIIHAITSIGSPLLWRCNRST